MLIPLRSRFTCNRLQIGVWGLYPDYACETALVPYLHGYESAHMHFSAKYWTPSSTDCPNFLILCKQLNSTEVVKLESIGWTISNKSYTFFRWMKIDKSTLQLRKSNLVAIATCASPNRNVWLSFKKINRNWINLQFYLHWWLTVINCSHFHLKFRYEDITIQPSPWFFKLPLQPFSGSCTNHNDNLTSSLFVSIGKVCFEIRM